MVLRSQTVDEDFALNACIENARNVSHILKAIHFKDTATIFATENGLKVTVEDSKCIQANAFIQDQVFQEYSIRDEALTFQINLDILQECLSIFGSTNSATSMRMMYNGYGTPLVLTLEEDGAVTDCSIKTMEPDDILDFEFSAANVVDKIIMKKNQEDFKHTGNRQIISRHHQVNAAIAVCSLVKYPQITIAFSSNDHPKQAECLREAFNEMDVTSEVLQITMSPHPPHFRLATFGLLGQSHHDIPKDSDMVEFFECNETQSNKYRLNLLKPSVKAVNLASKVCVRIDHRGFLSLQFMIKNENGQICFVEYYCCPDEEFNEPT